MPKVHFTKEYEKCRNGLLTRGKIGKDVYDKARVAEAEADEGSIRTVPRTHHGEDRIPDAEKYDLPGDHRLVLQRVNGDQAARVFLFVGSHDETEQWLENHRGRRFSPKPGPNPAPDPEKQRLQQELKKREAEQQVLAGQVEYFELENNVLGHRLRAREQELEGLASRVRDLEGQQVQVEKERQQVFHQRELLAAQQQQLANANAGFQDSLKKQAAEQLDVQIQELEEKERRLEAEKQHLAKVREQVDAEQRRLITEKDDLRKQLWERTEQLREALRRATDSENENRSLREQLRQRESEEVISRTKPNIEKVRRIIFAAVLGVAGLVVIAIVVALAVSSIPRDTSRSTSTTTPDTSRPTSTTGPDTGRQTSADKPTIIPPRDVAKFESKECTVEFTIKSKYNEFDWGLLLNSEKDFRNADNFTVIIEKQTAGEKYRKIGITDMVDYFKEGTVIQVTGIIEKHKDKRTDREQYQIRVKDPEQVKRR